jgi:hypothetical protein
LIISTGTKAAADAIEGVAALLPALHGLAMAVPEVGRQGQHAGVEQVAVFQRLVVEVVLGRQAQCACLDAHVDVLGHQHHLAAGVLLAQALHHAQDLVVGLALRQTGRQLEIQQHGLEEQLAAGLAVAGLGQVDADARVQRTVLVGETAGTGQRVEVAADLAHVARHLAHAFLVAVQFLQRDHRQEDVVFLEAEQAHRVVHQHVGVEHEELGRTYVTRLAGLGRRQAGRTGGGRRHGHGSAARSRRGDHRLWFAAIVQIQRGLFRRFGRACPGRPRLSARGAACAS